jgi:hypothetical protein
MYFVWITFFFYLIWVSRCCIKDLKRQHAAAGQPQARVGAQPRPQVGTQPQAAE